MNASPHPLVIAARYALIGVIWSGLMATIASLSQREALGDATVTLLLTAMIGATFISAMLLRENRAPRSVEAQAETSRKRKNESAVSGDPMSLLTDEDIEELRAEFKDELRRRYLQGLDEENAADATSFEALLEDRQQRKRR